MLRLLTRRVQHGANRPGHVGGCLKQQRRLADPGFPAEQDQRSGDDPSAQHAIELVDAGRQARMRRQLDLRVEARRPRCARRRIAMTRRTRDRSLDRPLLDKRVPRSALVTAAKPLRRLGAAFLADEDDRGTLGHGSVNDLRKRARCASRHGRPLPTEWSRAPQPSRGRRCARPLARR